ncbi:MAG: hypothetical protein O2791_06350, partial [Bacteroidetes bacterium]|nr:hypothetical protein [Bacteroidota bacterium]
MKNLVSLMMVLCCSVAMGLAQLNPMASVGFATEAPPGYCVSVEEVVSHTEGVLAGFTTYRVYMNCVNPNDWLSACLGSDDFPFVLNSSSGNWYNHQFPLTWNASGITTDPLILGFYPEMVYDSFLTIGLDNNTSIL